MDYSKPKSILHSLRSLVVEQLNELFDTIRAIYTNFEISVRFLLIVFDFLYIMFQHVGCPRMSFQTEDPYYGIQRTGTFGSKVANTRH